MQTDVLIIGGGLAGTVAADEIIKNSTLRVIQIGCGGGASPFIHGFCIPVSENDSEELFLEDSVKSGYGQSDVSLLRRLCLGSSELTSYFGELGLSLDTDEGGVRLIHSLGSSVPRIASIGNNTGPMMLRALRARLGEASRYTSLDGQRALSLIKANGRVVGARCFDTETREFYSIYAKTVILATGGFGRLFPESTNSRDVGGDGVAMAYLAGAALTDMEFIQFEPSAAVWPPEVAGKGIVTTMFYDGAVLRGRSGERFMLAYGEEAERVPKDVQAKCISHEMSQNGTTEHGGVWFDATGVPEEKWQGVYRPYLNRYLALGIDLRKEPVEIAPAAHTTSGGVYIDGDCYTGVPGLIACGEAAGGIHGANRLGGNAGLEVMVFGRIAGKRAIAEAGAVDTLPEDEERVPDTEPDITVSDIRASLSEIVRNSLSVVRSGEKMESARAKLSAMLEFLGGYEGCYEKHRLHNDLLTAYLTLSAALERTSSVGCHFREDGVLEEEKYRIEIKKSGEGVSVCRKPI